MPPKGLEPSGIILVDKPAGPSSFAIVSRVRRRLGTRMGHAGTLDPFATGVLVLLIGRGTKLCERLMDQPKQYEATIKFGATVTLIDEDTDKKQVWQIVGEPEANAKEGKISITSPIARALINKKKGENVEVNTPGGAKAYEITKIEWK